ncbi:hypothetical protein [Noviherbaspirillum pedocola]|uniref:Uncharacterized protein n=1 Tax=Noviherbaspirillum pedocola TaxID=2801341 RepID=A0A934T0N4_9BURK|nr:hypothetical protein [Noviherbaspirillum pedocola]MBK4739219.1 hypothetical protein [Noviherbaspirillum pedocola]
MMPAAAPAALPDRIEGDLSNRKDRPHTTRSVIRTDSSTRFVQNPSSEEVHMKHSAVPSSRQKASADEKQGCNGKNKMEPAYQEFCWYGDGVPATDPGLLKHDIRDVSDGLAVVLGMLEANDLNKQTGMRPLFSDQHACKLMRMTIAMQRFITDAVDHHIDAT